MKPVCFVPSKYSRLFIRFTVGTTYAVLGYHRNPSLDRFITKTFANWIQSSPLSNYIEEEIPVEICCEMGHRVSYQITQVE